MSSHDRTLKAFVNEIRHLTGVRVLIGWRFLSGAFLEDEETGSVYQVGGSKWQVLSPSQQESICRGFQREAWIGLLGLGPTDED